MDISYFGEFLTKQFPVTVLMALVAWVLWVQFNKFYEKQSREHTQQLNSQAERFNQAVAEERERLNEFWNNRETKIEQAMTVVAQELKEVSKQNRATNKILVYQSINNPALFKKSKSEKMNEILDILEEDKKNDANN